MPMSCTSFLILFLPNSLPQYPNGHFQISGYPSPTENSFQQQLQNIRGRMMIFCFPSQILNVILAPQPLAKAALHLWPPIKGCQGDEKSGSPRCCTKATKSNPKLFQYCFEPGITRGTWLPYVTGTLRMQFISENWVWCMVDKPYHRANSHSSFRLITWFAVEIELCLRLRHTPNNGEITVKRRWLLCIRMAFPCTTHNIPEVNSMDMGGAIPNEREDRARIEVWLRKWEPLLWYLRSLKG